MKSAGNQAASWRKITPFLALTFILSWGLDLFNFRMNGSERTSLTILILQVRMLVPAFSALLLQMFFWKDSSIHVSVYRGKPRWFFFSFFIMTILFAGLAIWVSVDPTRSVTASALSGAINMVVIMLLLALRFMGSAEEFAQARMSGGKPWQWMLGGAAILIFYGLSAWLNSLFKLEWGHLPEVADFDGVICGEYIYGKKLQD